MGMKYDLIHINTLVIGSGAAGLNAAIHFVEEGGDPEQIALVTEKLGGGTSFNTGSDKQTYYKLSISGREPDTVRDMAKTYYKGGSMHGDIALVESANSIREFMHLVSLGVRFPTNKYGEYVGYKTDNDPLQRATSIGPLTSREMSKVLLNRVRELGIPIYDKTYIFKILDVGGKKLTLGLKIGNLSQKVGSTEELLQNHLNYFLVDNIIAATGGSSIIYSNSIYPKSQRGSLGLLIEFGCETQNLTESQFGLGSTDFRWNVSGTYQQVIPTYLSSEKGILRDTTEFLNDHFPSKSQLLNAIFLKGYQWPFNSERVKNYGSSLIDLLVYEETIKKDRQVYLDFRKNPCNLTIDEILNLLQKEYANHLKKSGIYPNKNFESPIKRLKYINPKAYDLYLSHSIDLDTDLLAISVCAQHSNGGIAGDIWWETNKPNTFVIGEANGSHGVHRPGGAALNSGQVGGLRSCLKIINNYYPIQIKKSSISIKKITTVLEKYGNKVFRRLFEDKQEKILCSEILNNIQKRMAEYGTIMRKINGLNNELANIDSRLQSFFGIVPKPKTIKDILYIFRVYDALLTHAAYLHSIYLYLSKNGGSRGSYLVKKGKLTIPRMKKLDHFIVKTAWNGYRFNSFLEKRRPIPQESNWFETTWKSYEDGSWIK